MERCSSLAPFLLPPVAPFLLPPDALRLAATGRETREWRAPLLKGVLPAWPPGELFPGLSRYYRKRTGESDAALLLADDARTLLAPHRRLVGNEALHLAMQYGHAAIVAWLKTAYGLTASDAQFRPRIFLSKLCWERACMFLPDWEEDLYWEEDLSPRNFVCEGCQNNIAFLDRALALYAASCPQKDVRSWEVGELTPEEDQMVARVLVLQEGYHLRCVAARGDLPTIRVLWFEYGLGLRDALGDYAVGHCLDVCERAPLGDAIAGGHLAAIRWLWEASGVSPSSLRRGGERYALTFERRMQEWVSGAVTGGHVATVEWLATSAALSVRELANAALRGSTGARFTCSLDPVFRVREWHPLMVKWGWRVSPPEEEGAGQSFLRDWQPLMAEWLWRMTQPEEGESAGDRAALVRAHLTLEALLGVERSAALLEWIGPGPES